MTLMDKIRFKFKDYKDTWHPLKNGYIPYKSVYNEKQVIDFQECKSGLSINDIYLSTSNALNKNHVKLQMNFDDFIKKIVFSVFSIKGVMINEQKKQFINDIINNKHFNRIGLLIENDDHYFNIDESKQEWYDRCLHLQSLLAFNALYQALTKESGNIDIILREHKMGHFFDYWLINAIWSLSDHIDFDYQLITSYTRNDYICWKINGNYIYFVNLPVKEMPLFIKDGKQPNNVYWDVYDQTLIDYDLTGIDSTRWFVRENKDG